MNDIVKTDIHLPDALEDLTQFVLVGKAKLNAYMIKLQSVRRLSVAQEIRDQTLQEAQEVSTALIAAEQRIGEILLSIPKQAGRPSENNFSEGVEKLKTKSEITEEMGYTRHEVSDYQQMAKNPEVIQRVIKDALESGDVVTKTQVMREIRALKEEMRKKEESAKSVERNMLDEYDQLQKKYMEQGNQYRSLKESLNRTPEESKLEEDAESFIITTYNFIKKNGGFVWVAERVEELPENKLKEFKNAVYAIDAFARQMVNNIGGYDLE